MSKLRLLKLSNVQLPNGLDYLSNDLCLLDWHGYPSKYLPSNFQPDSLVTVKLLHGCLKRWNGKMGANLTELILEGCTNLVEIPSMEAIKRLTVLNLRGLKNLKVLPVGCWLKSLEKLFLPGCSKLENVSEVLASTECLIQLDLNGTCVKELPVEHLSNLESISLEDCKELACLPSGICGLKLLESLIVSGCSKLSKLPENLGELERLRSLEADFTAIKQPPSSIKHLKELRYLSFKGCKGPLFSSFFNQKEPMGFELPALSGLRSLTELDLRDCNFSEGFLPDDLGSLSSLFFFNLSGTNIISLPTSIRDLSMLSCLDLRNCKKLKTLPYLPTNIDRIVVSGCTSLETLTDLAIFPRQLDGSFTNCHTLLKNTPSLLLEFLRNILKKNKEESHKEESYQEESYIVVPGREIPKYFKYQNNMGHYVRIQVMPNWYERLRGIFVCAVFEATTPSIDAKHYAECYVMWNDVVVYSTEINIGNVHFQSDHLFLHYMALHDMVGEIRRRAEVNDLKENEIILYFRSHSPEIVDIVAPVKCAVDMVYENDEEWSDSHLSIQQNDYDEYILRKRSSHDYDYKEDIREQPNLKRLTDVVDQWWHSKYLEYLNQNMLTLDAAVYQCNIYVKG